MRRRRNFRIMDGKQCLFLENSRIVQKIATKTGVIYRILVVFFIDFANSDGIIKQCKYKQKMPFRHPMGKLRTIFMRISEQYMLRQVAEEYLVIPVGEAALKIKGLIGLSESGSVLYRRLQQGCSQEDLVSALLAEYDIDEDTARADIEAFLGQMRSMGILIEE